MTGIKDKIDKNKLPRHIAIIMDGNGRWAKERGSHRIFGHQNGVTAVKQAVEGAGELGVEYLTLYAFSKENWCRPQEEIDALLDLMVSSINSESEALIENNVRLLVIGDMDNLPPAIVDRLIDVINKTKENTGLTLIVALSYSARWEIARAARLIAEDVRSGRIAGSDIDEEKFACYLATADIPDPELLIRTSGEYRLSNFMLWQLAYAEMYFTPTLWPDFRKKHLYGAIADFQKRERRFGKTSEQLNCD
ncbi:MAG: isoprenyl transferase [Marinilabiliales bacterium]|nr:MAG: isoprenyl transferase [Marinilabiliales bacterium]